ncbi:MAG: hypothetical protein QOE56_1471 [Solirubrobacterales bacterium]|jgi:hypothetical protein|nr:hypothetical protein [Solirubrobacterales bacterium]
MLDRSRGGAFTAICMAAATLFLAGCGGDSTPTESSGKRPRQPAATSPDSAPPETVVRARCPADYPGCRSAEGRILYVERHDPDGDGDAHFVILDPGGITFRGLTSIDVEAGLRPDPLPGPGDLVSAAGPVQTGSFGQDQIHALVLNVGHSH